MHAPFSTFKEHMMRTWYRILYFMPQGVGGAIALVAWMCTDVIGEFETPLVFAIMMVSGVASALTTRSKMIRILGRGWPEHPALWYSKKCAFCDLMGSKNKRLKEEVAVLTETVLLLDDTTQVDKVNNVNS